MATLQSCLFRPTLQFLQVRNFRPLLSRSLRTRPSTAQPKSPKPSPQDGTSQESSSVPAQQPSISNLLAQTESTNNSLLAPVHIPGDPRAILKTDHPSTSLLEQSGIVVQRQVEMMNVFLGFEQANRYVIMDPQGNHIGYMAEHDGGIAKTMGRQWFRTHRAFMVHVFGRDGQEILRFHRPFSWINTRIRVYDPVELASGLKSTTSTDVVQSNAVAEAAMNQQISSLKLEDMRVIGEAQSEWAPLRRKYNLFLAHELPNAGEVVSESTPGDLSSKQQNQVKSQDHFAQFAYVDEPFLSWDFSLKAADEKLIGSVNRNWGGLGREFFTDTGTYVLRMDAAGLEEKAAQRHTIWRSHQGERAYAETLGGNDGRYGMTLDQRAVMLATAVTVDFDYFSRHSQGGGIIPMPLMMGGGGASEAGAAGGAAGAAGTGAEAGAIGETVSGGAIGTAGRAATGVGAGEGAMAGAGTMAGYEAMQRGMGRGEGQVDPQSPQAPVPGEQYPEQSNQYNPQSPQYGTGPEQQFPPEQGGPPQEGDVWGSGESDPWAGGDNTPGEGGGESGGWTQSLWDIFGGGD